jgi:hypothetical protein
MTFSNIDNLTNGQILQILFSKGLTSQMTRDYADYDNVLFDMNSGNATEREYRYFILKSLGNNAIKWQNPGTTGRAFPQGNQVTTQEVTAKMKEIQCTIELDWNLWDRARLAPAKYAEPLEVEIQAKLDATKREMAKKLYGDGSGILGTVASVSASGHILSVVLSAANTAAGFIANFEVGDKVVPADPTSMADHVPTGTGGTVAYLKVESVDRQTASFTASCWAAADTQVTTITAVVTAADVFYSYQQTTRVNTSSVADYGFATEIMAGLESLTATDGRVVHGVTMAGVTGGSRVDCSGLPIDVSNIEAIMNLVKIKQGVGRYTWDQLLMAFETQSAFLDSRESDRRFISVEDVVRGGRKFVYQHRNSTLTCVDSEFCPKNRVYSLPKPKSGEMGETGFAVEFKGTPFDYVKSGNQDQFLKPSAAGGYVGVVQSFLNAYGVIVAKCPGALGVLENFTI